MILELGPPDAFGGSGGQRTTLKQVAGGNVLWNPHEGLVEPDGPPIESLNISWQVLGTAIRFSGNTATLEYVAATMEEGFDYLCSACHILIPAISYYFRNCVWIRSVAGSLCGSRFTYELKSASTTLLVATREEQEQQVQEAVHLWSKASTEHTRFVSALYYFRHAVRLSQIQPGNEQCVAEIILNLTKAVEVLFSNNRDKVRKECQKLGMSDEFVEECVIPVLLLRSQVDVAHVGLTALTEPQLNAVVDFIQDALGAIHELLQVVEKALMSGTCNLCFSANRDGDREELLQAIMDFTTKRQRYPRPKAT